jgi:putative transposase
LISRATLPEGSKPACCLFYVHYAVAYRDLKEILAGRGDATLNRWAVKYSPLIAATAQARKRATAKS